MLTEARLRFTAGWCDMDTLGRESLLYDFYGELLTKHQRDVYESIIFQDMSLSETADEFGISRQGVHDLVKRCDRLLEDYENKLGLVERFLRVRNAAEELCAVTNEFAEGRDERLLPRIRELSLQIEKDL